jgi:chemotaxis protein MotB
MQPPIYKEEPKQLWIISYADFMTVLMIFFLVMYGTTVMAKNARQKMIPADQALFSESMKRIKDRLHDQVEINDEQSKTTIRLGEAILFQSGRSDLSNSAIRTLEELAKSIKLVEGDVIVQGHTDNVPMRGGRYKSNWELSAARTFSVIKELTRNGVPPERLAAWGFGEHRPLVDNLSAENRAQNRRIEVVVLKKKPKA